MILIYTILPDKKSAEEIAKIILKKRLAACFNYWQINSLYWWKGKIEKAKEWAMIIKTKKKNYQEIENLIKKNHPYEIPAIFSWLVNKIEKKYLKWLEKEIRCG